MNKNGDDAVVFVKTARQLAFEKIIYLLIALVVGGVFAGILLFKPDIPTLFFVLCLLAVLVAIVMAIVLVRWITAVRTTQNVLHPKLSFHRIQEWANAKVGPAKQRHLSTQGI